MKDSVVINQISYNIEELLSHCWQRLTNGSILAKHPYHTPAIATMDGNIPVIRTVVLRKVQPTERILIFYTDYRSPKIKQIMRNNNISWLFYDAKANIQLRVKSVAEVHHQSEIALYHWKNSRLSSRKCYLVQPAPSVISDIPTDGLPDFLQHVELTEENIAIGYDNFAVVTCKVSSIDWLLLDRNGHRRARFDYDDEEVKMNWVLP